MTKHIPYDFFISYTQTDKNWAAWIAWHLEESGYNVILQAWDFRPGSNFVEKMQNALTLANRTIAVLSPSYLKSSFARSEWQAAFASDPNGEEGKLLPIRVVECELLGLLPQIIYIDFVDLDEGECIDALIKGISQRRAKPDVAPVFPVPNTRTILSRPSFPARSTIYQTAEDTSILSALIAAVSTLIEEIKVIPSRSRKRRKLAKQLANIYSDVDYLITVGNELIILLNQQNDEKSNSSKNLYNCLMRKQDAIRRIITDFEKDTIQAVVKIYLPEFKGLKAMLGGKMCGVGFLLAQLLSSNPKEPTKVEESLDDWRSWWSSCFPDEMAEVIKEAKRTGRTRNSDGWYLEWFSYHGEVDLDGVSNAYKKFRGGKHLQYSLQNYSWVFATKEHVSRFVLILNELEKVNESLRQILINNFEIEELA